MENYHISILIFRRLNKKRDANLKLYKALSFYLKDYNIINSFNTLLNCYNLKNKDYEKVILNIPPGLLINPPNLLCIHVTAPSTQTESLKRSDKSEEIV